MLDMGLYSSGVLEYINPWGVDPVMPKFVFLQTDSVGVTAVVGKLIGGTVERLGLRIFMKYSLQLTL